MKIGYSIYIGSLCDHLIINPIPYGGGGVESTPPNQFRSLRLFLPRKHVLKLLDFSYNGYRQLMAKKKLKKFGGNPPYGPPKNLKNSNFSKVTQHDLL